MVTFNVPVIASPTLYQQQALAYLAARSNSWLRGLNQNTYLTKGDLSLNARNQLSVRWNRQNFTGLNFENGSATQSVEHTGSSIVNTDTSEALGGEPMNPIASSLAATAFTIASLVSITRGTDAASPRKTAPIHHCE